MTYSLYPIKRLSDQAVLSWRYEEPYALYSVAPAEAEQTLSSLLNPAHAYYEVQDKWGG